MGAPPLRMAAPAAVHQREEEERQGGDKRVYAMCAPPMGVNVIREHGGDWHQVRASGWGTGAGALLHKHKTVKT